MAIGTEKPAFSHLLPQYRITSIGHGPQVKLKEFLRRIQVVPGQSRIILSVSTSFAAPAPFCNQIQFAALPSGLLADIVLVAVIGVGILADPAAILALTSL
jgi:hypothetical protein